MAPAASENLNARPNPDTGAANRHGPRRGHPSRPTDAAPDPAPEPEPDADAVPAAEAPQDAQPQERPIPPTARAMLRIFPKDLPICGTPPENSSLATPGEREGNRVLAQAVGRRGRFLKARFSPGPVCVAP